MVYWQNFVLALCVAGATLSLPSFAESTSYQLETFPRIPTYFRHISVQDGLSQVTVADILQDKKGFMWFATQNGVNRYDGYEFIQYKRDKALDGSGPIGEFAYKLALDEQTSDIWIATSGGLSRYLYASDSFKHYALMGTDGEQRSIVPTIIVDRNGQLWAGTRQGLFSYQPQSDSFQSVELSVSPATWIVDVEVDSSGELLVATTEGLFAINQQSGEVSSALQGEHVTDIELLQNGDLWIATVSSGVLAKTDGQQLAEGLRSILGIASEIVDGGVNSVKQLSNGDIWVSANTGLSIVKVNGTLVSVDMVKNQMADNLLSAAHMTRTFESRSGLVWQGTWTSGFSVFDPDSQQINSLNARPNTWVRGLEADADENVWFGTPAGIWKRNEQRKVEGPWLMPTREDDDSSVTQSYIRSMSYDADKKMMWVGTTNGLYTLDPADTTLQKADILQQDNIFFVTLDPYGFLWIGTFNTGLYQIDRNSLQIKQHWNVSTITHVYADDEDMVLAGSIKGLLFIDKQSGKAMNLSDDSRPPEQRSPRVVTWISKSKSGDFLIGAQGSGVSRMNVLRDNITFFPIQPGSHLSTLSVGGVKEDSKGNLWVSTTEGIAKIEQGSEHITYFNKKNGAYSEGYYINHSLQLSSGEIVFAGPKGMSTFFPDDIHFSTWKPEVVLTKLLVLNKPVTPSVEQSATAILSKPIHIADAIELGPEDNIFSVKFSALDFSAPDNNQYAFMLTGFDKDWNTALAKYRVATYTNLDPGTYTLQVKGTNKDQVWSDNIASLKVVVVPPWYWNNWSKILWLVLALTLITLLYRWRVWALKERSEKLSRLVEKRTRDLEESNLKLRKLSSTDELTGLRNRRDFRAHADNELDRYRRTGTPFSILMIDLDDFKVINDENGHAFGDRALVAAANLMSEKTRKHDLLARWGGEEFIMLAVNTTLSEATHTAEKIRSAIEKKLSEVEGQELNMTVTIGVSEIQPDQTLDDCINRADKLLYEGKRNGRNQVIS